MGDKIRIGGEMCY